MPQNGEISVSISCRVKKLCYRGVVLGETDDSQTTDGSMGLSDMQEMQRYCVCCLLFNQESLEDVRERGALLWQGVLLHPGRERRPDATKYTT